MPRPSYGGDRRESSAPDPHAVQALHMKLCPIKLPRTPALECGEDNGRSVRNP